MQLTAPKLSASIDRLENGEPRTHEWDFRSDWVPEHPGHGLSPGRHDRNERAELAGCKPANGTIHSASGAVITCTPNMIN
jgi:hypothetical protein